MLESIYLKGRLVSIYSRVIVEKEYSFFIKSKEIIKI